MTDQELRDLVASLARSTDEMKKAQAATERQIKQTNKQLGELGNKFGSFAEGMALPSMEKVLYRDFGMNIVLPRAKAHRGSETLELDVLAHDNGDLNEVYIVEVKSHLTPEAIQQILNTIAKFPKFFPALAKRKIYGIIAAVYISEQVKNEVLNKGLYVARISDETFKLQVPKNFKAKAFGANGKQNGVNSKKQKKGQK